MYEITYVNTVTQSLKGKVKYKLDKVLFVETDNDETLVIPHQTINMGTQKDKILNSTGLIGAILDTDYVVKCLACIHAVNLSIDRNNDRFTATLVGGKSVNIHFQDLIQITVEDDDDACTDVETIITISPKGQVKPTRGKPCRIDEDEVVVPKKKDVSLADALRVFPKPVDDEDEGEWDEED